MSNPREIRTYLKAGEFLYSEAQMKEQAKAVDDARIWHRWLGSGLQYHYQYGIIPWYLSGIETLLQLQEQYYDAATRWNRNEDWYNELLQHNHAMAHELTLRMAKRLTRFEHGFIPINDYMDQGNLFTL